MEHGIPRLNECIHLFRHDYSKPNILQLINAASEIVDDTLVEIVLTGTLASGAMLFQCWNVKIAVKFGVKAKFFAVCGEPMERVARRFRLMEQPIPPGRDKFDPIPPLGGCDWST